jgi:hypothetical protein
MNKRVRSLEQSLANTLHPTSHPVSSGCPNIDLLPFCSLLKVARRQKESGTTWGGPLEVKNVVGVSLKGHNTLHKRMTRGTKGKDYDKKGGVWRSERLRQMRIWMSIQVNPNGRQLKSKEASNWIKMDVKRNPNEHRFKKVECQQFHNCWHPISK